MVRVKSPLLQLACLLLASPVVAQEAEAPLDRGERLLGEFHCTACHAAAPEVEARLAPQLAPRLDDVASRVTPGYLRRYLADPFGTNPMGRMPDQLAGLSADERERAARELTHYLTGLGEPLDRTPTPTHLAAVERGRRIFHETGCVACHRPQEEPWELEWTLAELFAEPEVEGAEQVGTAVSLPDEDESELYVPPGTLPHPDVPLELDWLAGKTTVRALAEFLRDPLAVRPSGRMPDLDLTEDEALDVARYLLRGQTSLGQWTYEEAEGLAYAYYEAPFQDLPRPVDWDALEPTRAGSAPAVDISRRDRDERFGFRWHGMLHAPEDGTYTFWTSSDDGSHVWIDGEHVVDNGGNHAMRTVEGSIDLDRGRHAIEVTFYEQDGGEGMELTWAGPGLERGPIPPERLSHAALVHRPDDAGFQRDEALARRGAERFVELGCATCHTTGDPATEGKGLVAAEPLDALAAGSRAGCLAPHGRIRFERPGDAEAVREMLGDVAALAEPRKPEVALSHTLDRLNCYACHRRKDLGGTHPRVKGYFLADETAELGDEGRIPPHLSQAGAKLREPWLEEVLLRGGTARPYMRTRMPRFGEANVGHLVELFAEADPPPAEPAGWDVSPEVLEAGHALTGKAGLGCVQCHTFAGRRSLGVQAVDLTTMVERIRYDWYRRLMLDPASLNMNTRMPSFWIDGESPSDLLGGDPERQIDAVWAFLSLGEGMAIPEGLATADDAYELTPTDEPITAGVFLEGVSPRTLVVGFPERAHYAFDMQGSRVAKLWRGDFFDARGTWEGRAGQLESPPSDDVMDLPPGPALARLADVADPWPYEEPRSLGRRFDADRVPLLRYAIGPLEVEERLEPELRFGGSVVRRRVTVRSEGPVRDLWFRPFAWPSGGDGWRPPESGEGGRLVYSSMDPALELALEGAPEPVAVVEEGVELRVPLRLERTERGYETTFVVEVSW